MTERNTTHRKSPFMPQRNRVQTGLGRNIREKRTALGLSQQLLAAKSGLDRSYISDVERGNQNTRLLTVGRIAKALTTTISALFEGIER